MCGLVVCVLINVLTFIGIIYYTMVYQSVPWRAAKKSDFNYQQYCLKTNHEGFGFPPLDKLGDAQSLMYQLLDPNPSTRPLIQDILRNPWVQDIECCLKLEHGKGHLVSVEHSH